MAAAVVALLLPLWLAPALRPDQPVLGERLEVEAGQTWSATVQAPALPTGTVPVLVLDARMRSAGAGGGNFGLQVLLNGRPLTERPARTRLLNKAPWFDPPGTAYHFAWFRFRDRGWMTVFAKDPGTNWTGTGQDTRFVFDLTGLVRPGAPLTLGLRHLLPTLPAALKLERVPLVVEELRLGGLPAGEVDRLRAAALAQQPLAVSPAVADPPPGEPVGEVPYEVQWSKRGEAPPAQVAFDDLRGWTVTCRGDAKVALGASTARRLWRPRLAKLTYAGGSLDTAIELTPPRPIPIAEPFDAADLLVCGGLDRQQDTFGLEVTALLEDADGRLCEVDLGAVRQSWWSVQHGVLRPAQSQGLTWPLRFVGLVIANCQAKGERTAWLESLAFYREQRQPPRRFERDTPPFFPAHDDGLLPTPPAGVRTAVKALPDGAEFVATAADGAIRYRVRPGAGMLAGVTVTHGEGPVVTPLQSGGLLLDGGPAPAVDTVDVALRGEDLQARWQVDGVAWTATYRLRGRTLVIDVSCPGGRATGLRFGTVAGLPDGRAVEVPYLLFSAPPRPCVAAGSGLFLSVLPDFYHSDFSTVEADQAAAPPLVALLSGTRYDPLTNGRRNDLRERVLVTASPELADVLPNPPNPPSPNLASLADQVFFMNGQMAPELYRTLRRLGVEHLLPCDFAHIFVDDYAEGFAGRWEPHPSLTVAQVQQYRAGLKALGYGFGAYLDTRDFFPLNFAWDPNLVALTSDGDWRDAWYGNFWSKPNAIAHLTRGVGRKMQELYPPDCVYLDTHTNMGPTAADFEAGVEGAGTARATVLGMGDSMVEARKWYASTISEGIYRWIYAGVCDLDYAQYRTLGKPEEVPPILDFDLLKLHPRQHGTMMGWGANTWLDEAGTRAVHADPGRPVPPEAYYRYLAPCLAYGHLAMLGYSYIPQPARFLHTVALMQGPQREYLTDQVAAIAYHDGTRFLPTSQAVLTGANARRRVRVTWQRGLTVYANLHLTEPWTVEAAGRTWELPPCGWVMHQPGAILAYSARIDGRRQDWVECPAYRYLRTGDQPGAEGALAVQGALWARREGVEWRLVPCGDLGRWQRVPPAGLPARFKDFVLGPLPADRGCREVRVDTLALLGRPPAAVKVSGLTPEGREVPVKAEVDDRWLALTASAEVEQWALR